MDDVNRSTLKSVRVINGYAGKYQLTMPERELLRVIAGEASGRPVLDLGVGGGRTVRALLSVSTDYVGVDYEPKMVDVCRQRFPEQRFETGDARDLHQFADASFFLVVFSCNGLGMISHAGRLAALAEIHRVLEPGGAFLFSTHNQNSKDHDDRSLRLPPLEPALNPIRLAFRTLRFARDMAERIYNRRRYAVREERAGEYSIINDECHNYGTMLYYITLANQRAQLVRAGFEPDALAYDLSGNRIETESRDSSITLLARKPRG